MEAMEWIAVHHGRRFSRDVALGGLPLGNGLMTIAHVERAFDNIGLSARIVEKSPVDVPLIVYPFLVFFEGGDVGIISGRRGKRGKFQLVLAGHKGTKRMSVSDLQQQCLGYVVYVSPSNDIFSQEENMQELAKGHWLWSTIKIGRASCRERV